MEEYVYVTLKMEAVGSSKMLVYPWTKLSLQTDCVLACYKLYINLTWSNYTLLLLIHE